MHVEIAEVVELVREIYLLGRHRCVLKKVD
jgi:hypothetical protein